MNYNKNGFLYTKKIKNYIMVEFILIQYSFFIIADRYNLKDILTGWANLLGLGKWGLTRLFGRFLYEVAECQFCTLHHLGVFSLIVFVPLYGFELKMLIYPLMGASAITIINKMYK